MKHLNKSNFPQCLVKSRWLKDAKDINPASLGKERKCPHSDQVENTRYGGVSTQSNLVAFYASKSGKAYSHAMKVMNQLVIDLKNMTNNELDHPKAKRGNTNLPYHIEDPLPVPTKGRTTQSKASKNKGKKKATDKPRFCKTCNGIGHDSRNCPATKDGVEKSTKRQKNISFVILMIIKDLNIVFFFPYIERNN